MNVVRISHCGVVTPWRERERQLAALGHEVASACPLAWNEGGSLVEFRADGDTFATPMRTFGSHPALFVYEPRALWRFLRAQHPDLYDIHEEPFSLAAAEVLVLLTLQRRRAPFVVYSAQNLDKRYLPPFSWLERWVLRQAAGAYVCNRAAAARLRRRGLVAEAAVVPLGVDTGRFQPLERDAPRGRLRVGYVGRLEQHKGVGVLIDAIAECEVAELDIIGDGPARAALRAAVARTGTTERVRFHGHVAASSLDERYRSLDVLAVPSLTTPSWSEQFCRVAVEAMASGVPVVASPCGALPEVLGHAGVLVPERSPTALARALAALAADPAHWARRRAAGLVRAQQFSWPAVARAQAGLYERSVR